MDKKSRLKPLPQPLTQPHVRDLIEQAAVRIGPHILHTPLMHSGFLSALNGGEVHLKLESEQHTGSFKARGALNKVLATPEHEKANGLVTASSGNHAQGFARALGISGDRGLVFLPENAVPSKVEALGQYPVELRFEGADCLQSELIARAYAEEHGMVWVSPYNDPLVIAGQGTIGKEIAEDLPGVDAVFATVGGGGMMSGVASWIKSARPGATVVGCWPENSPEMCLSIRQGEIVAMDESLDTLSDGSAGGLEPGAITFELCRGLIDDFVLQSEDEIAAAIRWMVEKHHKVIEGAAAVALGAYMKQAQRLQGKKVVIVICGGNISAEVLGGILR